MKGNTKTGHRVALYLRVSTVNGQTTDNQRRELTAWAKRVGRPNCFPFAFALASPAPMRSRMIGRIDQAVGFANGRTRRLID